MRSLFVEWSRPNDVSVDVEVSIFVSILIEIRWKSNRTETFFTFFEEMKEKKNFVRSAVFFFSESSIKESGQKGITPVREEKRDELNDEEDIDGFQTEVFQLYQRLSNTQALSIIESFVWDDSNCSKNASVCLCFQGV